MKFLTIFEKLNSMFKEVKLPDDWSLTSFLSAFAVIIPLLLWVVLCAIAGVLLAMPESILVIVISGLTGKVIDKLLKVNETIKNNKKD